MKITKAKLKQIIKEELAKESLFDREYGHPDEDETNWQEEGTPIEDLEFTAPEMEVFKADGEGAIRVLKDEAAFEEWKAAVGAGTMVKQGIRDTVWEPVSGPWKDRHDQLGSAKGLSVGRYGSN
tara:strand:+ start:674 stop:1045 length:372 start_codon:yes stop_codon:yes gene_type:complete